MSVHQHDAPSRASARAQAAPMPDAPPVTTATLPVQRPMIRPFEVAGALLGPGLHALLEVLGLARPVLLGQLALGGGSAASAKPRRMVSRVDCTASGADWAISVASADRRRAHLGQRHQHVGHAHGHRLVAGHAAAGVEEQIGLLLADQARQRDR